MISTRTAPSTGSQSSTSSMLLRSTTAFAIEQKAQSISSSWGGPTQVEFCALVKDWSTKYPDQAQRLVSEIAVEKMTRLTDESRFALVMALKSARTESSASSALRSLVDPIKGHSLLGVDATVPIGIGPDVDPKYNLSKKVLFLKEHLGLTD